MVCPGMAGVLLVNRPRQFYCMVNERWCCVGTFGLGVSGSWNTAILLSTTPGSFRWVGRQESGRCVQLT